MSTQYLHLFHPSNSCSQLLLRPSVSLYSLLEPMPPSSVIIIEYIYVIYESNLCYTHMCTHT